MDFTLLLFIFQETLLCVSWCSGQRSKAGEVATPEERLPTNCCHQPKRYVWQQLLTLSFDRKSLFCLWYFLINMHAEMEMSIFWRNFLLAAPKMSCRWNNEISLSVYLLTLVLDYSYLFYFYTKHFEWGRIHWSSMVTVYIFLNAWQQIYKIFP